MEEKNISKKTRVKFGSILIISFLLLYIPSFFNWVFGSNISTEIIRLGTLEDSINVDGYLIRDEEVLSSPFTGSHIIKVNEGEKVPTGFTVATVLKDSTVGLLDDLKKKEEEITKAQMEKSKNQEIFSEDIVKLDNEIGQKIRLITNESNGNNLGRVRALKSEIDGLIQRKAAIFGGTSISDVHINALKKEKVRLQEQINSNTRQITAKSSGIISYSVDGYETSLTPGGIRNLTPKFLEAIKHKEPSKVNTKTSDAEKPFAKIIKDIEAYIVVVLEPQKAARFKVDDTIDEIRINQAGYTTNGSVYFKSSEEDGKYIVAIRVDKGISETAALRKINIDIVKNSYKGWKVPLKSLIEVDYEKKGAKIVLVKANYASIREVRIIGKNDEYAIIDNVEGNVRNTVGLYDTYILNPQNIEEGQLINQ